MTFRSARILVWDQLIGGAASISFTWDGPEFLVLAGCALYNEADLGVGYTALYSNEGATIMMAINNSAIPAPSVAWEVQTGFDMYGLSPGQSWSAATSSLSSGSVLLWAYPITELGAPIDG